VLAPLLFFGVCCAARANDTTVQKLQLLINQSLHPGDSTQKIEAFLREYKLPFDFDPFNSRYQSRVPNSETKSIIGVEGVVIVYIYVAKDRSFQKAEVRRIYTYL